MPRLISWPIIACLWLLLGVLITAGFLAWDVQVPTYVDGPGIILAPGDMPQPEYGETLGLMFLPPDQAVHMRTGLPVGVQIGSTGVRVRGMIAKVEPGITSPNAARKRYRLDSAGALLITQPSTVVIIRLGTTLPASDYAGSLLNARVETGSQRLLALLPGLGSLLGSSS
ncbi:MAG TPA: hypothetical protein VF026_07570 [Ktedonobacteraceae bacterium]